MNLTNFTIFGRILKPHGIHGEMAIEYFVDIFDSEELPFLFFELDGLYVPFEINDVRNVTSDSAILSLVDIDTEEKASELTGLSIYVSEDEVDIDEKDEYSYEFFIGFRVDTTTKKSVGIIQKIDSTTDNVLFILDNQGNELLIPASEDYILEINTTEKSILMDLPEGLLEL